MKNVGWKVSINCLIYAHKQTKTLSGGIFNSPVWLLSEEKGEEGRKSMEYVLELKNIYKSFPGVKVLEDVTLQVRPGEVHALMGENGAGKSTLMKILMGIYKAEGCHEQRNFHDPSGAEHSAGHGSGRECFCWKRAS